MADDKTLRPNWPTHPYRRDAEPARPSEPVGGSDPLAELARLIGQNDPFAETGRNAARDAPRPHSPPPPAAADWQHASPAEQHRYPSHDIYAASADYADPPARHEPYAEARNFDDRQFDDRHYADRPDQQHYADRHDQPRYVDQHDQPRYAEPHDQRYDARSHDGAGRLEQGHDHYYQDEAAIEPHEDEMYDDAPGSRRRGGLVTVLALIGCAMMGTAGAYGYRSYYADTGSKEPPPVIAADTNTPTKVVPTGAAGDPQASKAINERFANAAAGKEQIVSRQEEPVALKEPGTPSAPRVVLPSPVAPAPSVAPAQAAAPPQAAPPVQPAAAAAAAPSPGGSGGPKRVRTVTIRPDGADPSGRPVGASPVQGASVAPAPRTTPPAARAAAPAHNQNGPLSLDPQGQPIETGTAPAHARARIAANPPAARAAPEPAEPSAGGSGGNYVVQISSQTSERDARASFQSLQAKFPDELGGRQPIIRRADLGAKGIFYRTNVGPFASIQEAGQFCVQYRAAGGQCVVPRN